VHLLWWLFRLWFLHYGWPQK